MVVKILVELLSMLALVTEELNVQPATIK